MTLILPNNEGGVSESYVKQAVTLYRQWFVLSFNDRFLSELLYFRHTLVLAISARS